MSRILVTVWPYPGAVRQLAAIGAELRSRGHDVAFYSGTRFRRLLISQGFEFFPLQPSIEIWFEKLFRDPEGAGRDWSRSGKANVAMIQEFFLGRLHEQIEDLDEIRQRWDFDAILCEFAMLAPRIVYYEARGVPVVLFDTPSTTIPGPDVGVPGVDMAPPRGWTSRLAAKVVRRIFDFAVREFRRDVSAARARYGLGPVRGSVMEMAAELPLVIVPSCPEFDYQRRDLPPNYKYVGSCLTYPPLEESLNWIDAALASHPLIHVSEGTVYTGHPYILRAAIEALGDGPFTVVLTTGEQRRSGSLDLGLIPPNVHVRSFIPHSDLIPRMDLVVTHGGQGTVTCSLSNGVPLVAVPLMWDQLEHARRLEFTGAGIRLPLPKLTPRRLRSAVDRVLADVSYRRNAGRISVALGRYGGPRLVAELFEERALPRAPVPATA